MHGPQRIQQLKIGDVWFFLNISKSIAQISIPFKLLHSGDRPAGGCTSLGMWGLVYPKIIFLHFFALTKNLLYF